MTLAPDLLNLVVGDTRTIQALDAAGQPVTGLTWTSSDTTVVSLSSADPPVLTALAPGQVTITAGTAIADVTVWTGFLPVGTARWSNPGNGSGVYSFAPAVPTPTSMADVFAFQYDGTVQAITAEGNTAWTADVSQAYMATPDFQGGLIAVEFNDLGGSSLVKFDGATGQRTVLYSTDGTSGLTAIAVHTDGTVFANQTSSNAWDGQGSAIGVDIATGALKFTVPLNSPGVPTMGGTAVWGSPLMIGGDGYAYVPHGHQVPDYVPANTCQKHLGLLRIDSSGAYSDISLHDWSDKCLEGYDFPVTAIANGDTGILLNWDLYLESTEEIVHGMALTDGTSLTQITAPEVPGELGFAVALQLQNGSFIGTAGDGTEYTHIVAFDQAGGLLWSLYGMYDPKIATADGGLIAASRYDGSAVILDQNGNVTGQMASMPTYSWKGAYELGSTRSVVPAFDLAFMATTFAAAGNGNLTGNGFSLAHHTFGLVFCGPAPGDGNCPLGTEQVTFAYLPVIDDTNYRQAVAFTSDYPGWVTTIKARAYGQFRAAFDKLPAIVAAKERTYPLYGGSTEVTSFRTTHYITGEWVLPGAYERGDEGYPANGYWPFLAMFSRVYYLPIMGNAQQALGYVHGSYTPVSPAYNPPPMTDPDKKQQFAELVSAIGYAIGNAAAHETGHIHRLPGIDCLINRCEAEDVYELDSSGSNHEWWYAPVPGRHLHWSHSGRCKLQKVLLGSAYQNYDSTCQ